VPAPSTSASAPVLPTSPSVAASPSVSASPSPSETVVRVDPDQPGLAHGRWEAPSWAFYLIAGAAIVGGLGWLGVVLGTRTGRSRS